MFTALKEIIGKRVQTLGITGPLADEEQAFFIRNELAAWYGKDPSGNIRFPDQTTINITVSDFSYFQDLQLRRDELLRRLNEMFPKKPRTKIFVRVK